MLPGRECSQRATTTLCLHSSLNIHIRHEIIRAWSASRFNHCSTDYLTFFAFSCKNLYCKSDCCHFTNSCWMHLLLSQINTARRNKKTYQDFVLLETTVLNVTGNRDGTIWGDFRPDLVFLTAPGKEVFEEDLLYSVYDPRTIWVHFCYSFSSSMPRLCVDTISFQRLSISLSVLFFTLSQSTQNVRLLSYYKNTKHQEKKPTRLRRR